MIKDIEKFHEDPDQYAKPYIDIPPEHRPDLSMKQRLIQRVLPMLRGPDVLEMGAGIGDWTSAIVNRFGRSHVVEGSKKLVEMAKESFDKSVQVHHSFFEDFDPEMQYDSIVCSLVLEHVRDPVECLRRMKRWLKPGGIAFVSVPNADSLHRKMGVILGIQKDTNDLGESDRSIGHRRVSRQHELEFDLENAGFRILCNLSMGLKVLPNSLLMGLTDAQLAALIDLGEEVPPRQRAVICYLVESSSSGGVN